jgi:hypothetical protein
MIKLALDLLKEGIISGKVSTIAKCKVDSSWNAESVSSKSFISPVEFFYPNQLYGHSTIIRLFYGLNDRPMPLVIPHMIRDYSDCWSMEIESGYPILCYSDFSYLTYFKACLLLDKPVNLYKSRHPLKLLKKILDRQANDMWKKSHDAVSRVLYFPDHSTGRIDGKLYDNFYEKKVIDQLKKKYSEVNICFYFIDLIRLIESGRLHDFECIYDNVYCCGDRYSPDFLLKLSSLLMHHDSIAYSAFGSISYLSTIFQNTQIVIREKLRNFYSESNVKKMGADGKFWIDFDKKIIRNRIGRHNLDDGISNIVLQPSDPQLTRFINIPDSECQLKEVLHQLANQKININQVDYKKIYPMINGNY